MRRFSAKLAFILLFAFCGQVLAMPFLDCCAETQVATMSMNEMPSSSMTMHSMEHDHEAMISGSDMQNCDHSCDICLTAGSFLTVGVEAYPQSAMPTVTASFYQSVLTSSHSDSLYRPPIIA